MGNWIQKALSGLLNLNKEARILMLGLDAAGKTTVLYKLKLGELVSTTPTIGFNVERVEYSNLTFTIWDIGGQNKIRKLWHHYYLNTDALVYIVDSADRERIDEAGLELQELLRADELRDAVLLVFANKQDLPTALSTSEVVSALGLHSLRSRTWHVQGACARSGDGLVEGLEWLASALTK